MLLHLLLPNESVVGAQIVQPLLQVVLGDRGVVRLLGHELRRIVLQVLQAEAEVLDAFWVGRRHLLAVHRRRRRLHAVLAEQYLLLKHLVVLEILAVGGDRAGRDTTGPRWALRPRPIVQINHHSRHTAASTATGHLELQALCLIHLEQVNLLCTALLLLVFDKLLLQKCEILSLT